MSDVFNRRYFLTACIAAMSSAQAFANPPTTSLRPVARGEDLRRRFQPAAEALIEKARLGGAVGFAVQDLAEPGLLEAENPETALPPASVAKALTAAYALDALGPDHHFVTELVATAPIVEGRITGDLVLAGGGDPTLTTDGLAQLARRLRDAGVTRIDGRFLVWDGALPKISTIDDSQPPHVGYSPALSGLNLNFNRVHFGWKRVGASYDISMQARDAANRPEVSFARMRVEARQVPVYTYANRNGRDDWTVAKGALGNGGSRWLPVRKPGLYAGEVFQSLAAANGIALGKPQMVDARPDGQTIASFESKPLRVILRDMLKYSTNLTAEVVGLAASAARQGRPPETLHASAQAMSLWASETYGLTSMDFVDHSGLGEDSRISAADMVKALVKLRKTRGLKPLLKSFPMRDAKRRVIKDHPISVHAKTGTLNFVSGLAGYIDLPDGRELVFAVFTANQDLRAALTQEQREKPPGGKSWNIRAKTLQQALIERWGVIYGL